MIDTVAPGRLPASVGNRTDQVVAWVERRIRSGVFAPEARLPSIRALAATLGVSPFTVAAAYDRLAASGAVRSRPGSGVFVLRTTGARESPAPAPTRVDVDWLMHHMLSSGGARGPGVGGLPSSWLDGPGIAAALRGLGREGPERWLRPGQALGYEPLRRLLQHRLADHEVVAGAEQIVLTTGVTQGLDLALRARVRPGDAVVVFTPVWFGALAMLSLHGAKVVPIPWRGGRLDLDGLKTAFETERPRMVIISATSQNPTGRSLAATSARRVLALAQSADCLIFEDDVYGDLARPGAVRMAAGDALRSVIYAGSFSKTLAGNVRVGFLAAAPDLAAELTRIKTLSSFTTPEVNERLIGRLLAEGRYDRHTTRLNERLDAARTRMLETLARAGFEVRTPPTSGLFAWVDMRCDTTELAALARDQGQLVAPGALFTTRAGPSRFMRVNVTTALDDAFMGLLRLADRLTPLSDMEVGGSDGGRVMDADATEP